MLSSGCRVAPTLLDMRTGLFVPPGKDWRKRTQKEVHEGRRDRPCYTHGAYGSLPASGPHGDALSANYFFHDHAGKGKSVLTYNQF